jgi:hypothetical protein
MATLMVCLPALVSAQIDPVKRDLIQFGYNQPLEGRAPLAAYAYYYRNEPDFLRTNMTLRLAVAPVYLDWLAEVLPTVTTRLTAADGTSASRLTVIRQNFPPVFITSSTPRMRFP